MLNSGPDFLKLQKHRSKVPDVAPYNLNYIRLNAYRRKFFKGWRPPTIYIIGVAARRLHLVS